jgi:hypothetical protein
MLVELCLEVVEVMAFIVQINPNVIGEIPQVQLVLVGMVLIADLSLMI